jgi:hypothetical protein
MTIAWTDKDIAAQNTFTDWVQLEGTFNLNISGTWEGTLTVQRKFSKGDVSVLDVPSGIFTSNGDFVGNAGDEAGIQYRVGFKTGEYASGTATVRLSQ